MVNVVMTTYNPEPSAPRFEYAYKSMRGLLRHLRAAERVDLIVADDGSPSTNELSKLRQDWRPNPATVVTGPHNGIGASLNRALEGIVGPWMYTTDDWLLTEDLDLDFPLWLLDQGYDLVRLGPIHPNLDCTTMFTAGHGWWLDLKCSSVHGGFAFATRPFLAAPSLTTKIGPFLEGVDAYACERDYSDRVWDHGAISIAAINLAGPWVHIGDYEVGDRDPHLFQMEKVDGGA